MKASELITALNADPAAEVVVRVRGNVVEDVHVSLDRGAVVIDAGLSAEAMQRHIHQTANRSERHAPDRR